jgi:hypothetical protein
VGEPRLLDRIRSLQLLLGVGAVLVVAAAAAVAGAYGGSFARIAFAVLAAVAAALSLVAALDGLHSTEETLAACAGGLGLVSAAWHTGSPLPAGIVAAICLGLHLAARSTAAWPLASWAALQLAVLKGVDGVPRSLHPSLFLAVALVGLGIALWGRRLVARAALVTAVPWWGAGVAGGLTTAWSGSGAARPLAAVLVVVAAAGLLPARLRAELDVLQGPRTAVPVLAGGVAGVAVAGALAAAGTVGITAAGYVGVLLASTLPEYLNGWRRGLFRPVLVTGGSVLALSALVELSARGDWGALVVLFLLTALPTLLVASRHPAARPGALPWAVGCLAAAAVLAVPAGWLDPLATAVMLTGVYAAGLAAAATLAVPSRPPTLVAAGAAAAAAVVLVVLQTDREPLALLLALQGVVTVEWAGWTATPEQPPSVAWRLGAAQWTVAIWLAVSTGSVHVLEEYTLPLAAGLLLAQGPRLVTGPSWPAWGPGLLVAAVPSAVMAVVLPGITRPVVVLSVAALGMVLAAAAGLRAPLVIGASTAVGTTLALALATLVWPVVAALLIGAVLLGVGAREEFSPVASFAAPLAKLR